MLSAEDKLRVAKLFLKLKIPLRPGDSIQIPVGMMAEKCSFPREYLDVATIRSLVSFLANELGTSRLPEPLRLECESK